MLAVSETASWVLAFVVAAVVLTVLTLMATRRPSARVLVGVAAAALAGTLVAGGAGAAIGERDFPHHEHTTPVAVVTAKDLAFDRKVIGLPATSEVEIEFINLDVGTLHNVAIYTQGDPGTPIFNGAPTSRGEITYELHSPPAGTYRYVCDFHPDDDGRASP